jgi:hypothetical protein
VRVHNIHPVRDGQIADWRMLPFQRHCA